MATGELGGAAGWERFADLRRQADHARSSGPRRHAAGSQAEEEHRAGHAPALARVVDPGHCRDRAPRPTWWTTAGRCNARSRAQGRPSRGPAGPPRRRLRLWSAGLGILVAAVALLAG